MDPMLLRAFQEQVLTYCHFAILAADDLDSAAGMTRVWYAIQNLLTATANIAKALWGTGGRFAQEREPLRRSIAVDDSSPLKDITPRNHFEHYDERLDRWWSTSSAHNYIDMNIGPVHYFVDAADIDMFRNYDPATGSLFFWGERYSLPAIIAEVHRILPLIEVAKRQ